MRHPVPQIGGGMPVEKSATYIIAHLQCRVPVISVAPHCRDGHNTRGHHPANQVVDFDAQVPRLLPAQLVA